MDSEFDATASTFERHRSLPKEAAEAIRAEILAAVRLSKPAQVLEVGAGTGRIGKVFIAAGDSYVGVDASLAMLRKFSVAFPSASLLQADGRQLPFGNGAFDVVLFMHVLSSIADWQGVLIEARRVLRPGGAIAVGHTISPETGIDAQLKRRLKAILSEMQIDWHKPEKSRQDALVWLESSSEHHVRSQAVSWNVETTPRNFLQRHRTGARFAALPADVQEQALRKLHTWADANFGSVDTVFQEIRIFELDLFQF